MKRKIVFSSHCPHCKKETKVEECTGKIIKIECSACGERYLTVIKGKDYYGIMFNTILDFCFGKDEEVEKCELCEKGNCDCEG